jgi:hypothetical protein
MRRHTKRRRWKRFQYDMITNHNSDKILVILTKHYGFVIDRISNGNFQLNHQDGRRLTIPRHKIWNLTWGGRDKKKEKESNEVLSNSLLPEYTRHEEFLKLF